MRLPVTPLPIIKYDSHVVAGPADWLWSKQANCFVCLVSHLASRLTVLINMQFIGQWTSHNVDDMYTIHVLGAVYLGNETNIPTLLCSGCVGALASGERGTFGVSLTGQGRPHSRRRQTFGSFIAGCCGREHHHGNKVRLSPVNGAGWRQMWYIYQSREGDERSLADYRVECDPLSLLTPGLPVTRNRVANKPANII
jgi:hypothetical protein